MDFIKEKLQQGEYRLTRQRQVILDVLQEAPGEHLTAEEVLQAARHKSPRLGIATVYRTLERLASLGVLYKSSFDEGRHRYEMADAGEHHHLHIQCVNCGRIFELEESLLDGIEREVRNQGFEVMNHRLTIHALCPRCQSG